MNVINNIFMEYRKKKEQIEVSVTHMKEEIKKFLDRILNITQKIAICAILGNVLRVAAICRFVWVQHRHG